MRIGHKYISEARESIDSDVGQYAATMGYEPGRFTTPEDFLRAHDQRWVHEIHNALCELLDRGRTVLSIGSGEGEHDVLLHLAGYDVIATDVVPGVLDDAARLFPGFRTARLDAFSDDEIACDDVLATGMEFYFDDAGLSRLMRAVRRRLEPGGRFVIVQRYRDTPGAWAVDRIALPLSAGLRRVRGERLTRKAHGYRRSIADIERVAAGARFRIGRVRHAAFAMELERVLPAPGFVVRADRRAHLLNSAVAIELLAE